MEKHDLWKATLSKLALDLSRPSFLTWFQNTSITDINEGIAMVCVPNSFAREWLQNKYHKNILHALRTLAVDIKDVHYIIGKPNENHPIIAKDLGIRQKLHPYTIPSLLSEESVIKDLTVDPITNLNPRYTFATFIVGSFNELANAAAEQVIKNPGIGCNPFFIYGGTGLGKTHLIQAIGNELIRKNAGFKVRYASSEKYMGEIVEAIKNAEMQRLKEKYRAIDLFIIDDIQFIARTEKMQEEFFHTFNSLYERNKQIIVSSDRPPRAISTLEERLRSRFEGGTVTDIGLPDLETRLLILKTKAQNRQLNIPEDILRFIAEKIKNNIRELEGALNKLVIAGQVSNVPITMEAAKKAIMSHLFAPKKFVSAKKIIKSVAEFFDIEERELLHRSRKRDIVRPRQIAMYLMREELKSSYPSIGERFGGRDHTTAIHSCEKVGQDLIINPELEDELRAIKERIYSDKP